MNESLKYSFLLTQKSKLHIEKLKDFAIGISYSFLSNLKSNLTLRLTEQEQSLESAKSEVKSNIK